MSRRKWVGELTADLWKDAMGRQGTSIRDIARHLGVSVSTVSRAMNDRADVNAATRTRVQEAARALSYAPDQSGRSLRQGRTHTVAMTVRTDIGRALAGETFFLGLCQGLQPVLAEHGLDLVILPCGSAAEQDRYLRRAVERRLADGFIISDTTPEDERVAFLIARGVPFVALGRTRSGTDSAWLDLDVVGMARDAVTRLATRGHRRIALGTLRRDITYGRLFEDGYRAAVAELGLSRDPSLIVRVPDTPEGGSELMDAVLAMPERPTAMVLLQETMAIEAYRRLGAAGLRPGHDMAMIGFRQNQVIRHLEPVLTCFELSLRDYGARLGAMMRDTMEAGTAEQVLWPVRLGRGDTDTPCRDAAVGRGSPSGETADDDATRVSGGSA